MIVHIVASGLIGGFTVCGSHKGNAVYDADKSNCPQCVRRVRDCLKALSKPSQYEPEVRRACAALAIPWEEPVR
jgi:hypothetical protein